jgi:hypothetical protein
MGCEGAQHGTMQSILDEPWPSPGRIQEQWRSTVENRKGTKLSDRHQETLNWRKTWLLM